jgi:hypothetical protein
MAPCLGLDLPTIDEAVESTLADEAFVPAEDVESKAQALDTPLVMLDSTMVVSKKGLRALTGLEFFLFAVAVLLCTSAALAR